MSLIATPQDLFHLICALIIWASFILSLIYVKPAWNAFGLAVTPKTKNVIRSYSFIYGSIFTLTFVALVAYCNL